MPVIPAFRRLRREDQLLEDNLGYTARPCLKNLKTQPDAGGSSL
jgi:hypothetical protein